MLFYWLRQFTAPSPFKTDGGLLAPFSSLSSNPYRSHLWLFNEEVNRASGANGLYIRSYIFRFHFCAALKVFKSSPIMKPSIPVGLHRISRFLLCLNLRHKDCIYSIYRQQQVSSPKCRLHSPIRHYFQLPWCLSNS